MKDLELLFTQNIPLIDVRAPVEFNDGHFPHSVNLPLMNDEERRLVGIRYKEAGPDAAVELGHQLVNGTVKQNRVNAWLEFIQKNPTSRLYCFRGGLRSQISTQWIQEAGGTIEYIPGGYKQLRRFLMETIEQESRSRTFYLIAGKTGSAKTVFLKKAGVPFIDLEKHANHKGSSFGEMGAQPSQITFENRVAVDLLKTKGAPVTLLEDESIMIGSAIVPKSLFQAMSTVPIIVLEKGMEERIQHIIREYVTEKTESYQGDFNQTRQFMIKSLHRIQKKLGGLEHGRILKLIDEAFSKGPEPEHHREWVEALLLHYYDAFYERALKRNAARIVFRGNEQECSSFIRISSNLEAIQKRLP